MVNCYNDIITLRESSQAYNIQSEEDGMWKSFIANKQFNDLLKNVLRAVRNNDADTHKSFWIDGTYGSGKSHAAAVIQHLLCDKLSDIKEYVDQEYSDPEYNILHQDILSVREGKRLLPVHLYGQQNIANERDLSLEIQRAVKLSLEKINKKFIVRTDFDNYADHIDSNPGIWNTLIQQSAELRSVAPTLEKLRHEILSYDTDILYRVKKAEDNNQISIKLNLSHLKSWLLETEEELKKASLGYSGFLIIWDEFTEIMRSAIGLKLLTPLQEIAETLTHKSHDSYFLFITHPSAFNGLESDESSKTKGRFHYIHYNMDTVSAFKIMSRKFVKVNARSIEYETLYNDFYSDKKEILTRFSRDSNSPDETQRDLMKVFPIHPYTANLATYYAREIGSSSRSVFQFMACDLVKAFLKDEEMFANRHTITADMLWDYVRDDFESDSLRFAAVTERYNNYRIFVEKKGRVEDAVFKGILLLNALNNIAQNPTVTPSEENIKDLFIGTPYYGFVDNAMGFLNENSIVQRNPMGLFNIQFSALPMTEVQDKKKELENSTFAYTYQVIKFGETAKEEFNKILKNTARPYSMGFYSVDVNEHTLLSKIENGRKKSKSYEVFLALLFAKTSDEVNLLKSIVEKASKEDRFSNVAFIVFDTPMGAKDFDRFIEYMALSQTAQQHSLMDQVKAHNNDANSLILSWLNNLKRGNLTYYLRGTSDVQNARNIPTTVNEHISPVIFDSGPESLDIIRAKHVATYWKKCSAKKVVDTILSYNTKEEIIEKCGGPAKHIDYLLQDSVDDNLDFKSDIDEEHPLYKVYKKIESKFKDLSKSNITFNLEEELRDLTKPPYGLFQSFAPMAIVAFALRPYVKQLFDQTGKPREAQHLVEDVVEMFKAWEDEKPSNKLNYQFQSKETGELCEHLVNAFKLNKLPKYSNVSSIIDARWAITHEFSGLKGYPLWSLKYADINDDLKALVDKINTICDSSKEALKNQTHLKETLQLIKQYLLDLKQILSQDNLFKAGFINFLKLDANVKFKESEIMQVEEYLHKHLNSTIGLWREDEVRNELKNWRLSTLSIPEDKIENINNFPHPISNPLGYKPTGIVMSPHEIYNSVKKISGEELKGWILDACQKGDEYILKMLESYVQKR